MIFVHGAGVNEKIWLHHMQDFPDALFPTLKRSCGNPPSIQWFTQNLNAFIDAHALDTTILVGHSLGGGVALDYALAYPDRVDGLILISASPKFQVPEHLLTMILEDFNQFIDTIVKMGFHQDAPESAREDFRNIMKEMLPEEVHFDYACANTFDIQDKIQDITAPSLVIAPEDDGMIPLQIAEWLAEQLKNSRLTLIPRAGHMVIVESPELVTREIKKFLAHVKR
jgi:pimeloyl-ACP methyl ester carboxylesterase